MADTTSVITEVGTALFAWRAATKLTPEDCTSERQIFFATGVSLSFSTPTSLHGNLPLELAPDLRGAELAIGYKE